MVSVRFDEMRELFYKTVARDRPPTPNRARWGIDMRRSYFFEGLPESPSVTSPEDGLPDLRGTPEVREGALAFSASL
jgi:hypothetical protein